MPAEDCVFCKILAGELPVHVIAESERAFAFADINPATRGHTLVVPRLHVADIHEISAADLTACVLLAQDVARLARDRLGADGVNVLHSTGRAAWQLVPHFHVHVIPRYAGDQLRLPCAPPPADAKEIAAMAATLRG